MVWTNLVHDTKPRFALQPIQAVIKISFVVAATAFARLQVVKGQLGTGLNRPPAPRAGKPVSYVDGKPLVRSHPIHSVFVARFHRGSNPTNL